MSGMHGRRRPKPKLSKAEAQEAAIYVGIRVLLWTLTTMIVALGILMLLKHFHAF